MRVLLAKEYLDQFNLRDISKSIYRKFDEYNYKIYLSKTFTGKTTSKIDEVSISRQKGMSNPTLNSIIKREQLLKNIKEFSNKIKYLKSTLTDDERLVFKYGIEQRLTDDELSDELAKSLKTTRYIKKSCYVKVALHFDLIKNKPKQCYNSQRAIN